ncbi:MAG: hypothetical protein JO057_26565 [Chloroflexi bacterium]|nr:hypothetical protein [Chloroflexota bacterium]
MSDSQTTPIPTEPTLRPQPTSSERDLTTFLERGESMLTSVVGVILAIFVLVALAAIVVEVKDPLLAGDLTTATLRGIDATFLAIILLELLHTTLSRGPISQQLQEFLVIGITATIRHSLEVAAERGDPRDVVVNLTINAVGALLLVTALWLVRHHLRADRRQAAAHTTTRDAEVTGRQQGVERH